jgi:hypothetical protein
MRLKERRITWGSSASAIDYPKRGISQQRFRKHRRRL